MGMKSNDLGRILQERGLKSKDLAKMTGLSEPTISQIVLEKGMPSLKTTVKVMDALDLKFEDIFNRYYTEED